MSIVLLLIICISFYVYKRLNAKNDDKPTEIVELAKIPGYNYALEDRDTELYKKNFDELKEVLTSKEIDYNKYAELMTKLYIIDLYTLSNKMNHYDVGGSDFVLDTSKEDFEARVKDSLYKYVEDNSYGKRNQELPEVSSIEIVNTEAVSVKKNTGTYEGYKLRVKWDYVKDLNYDNKADITIIKLEDKLYITNQVAS